MASERVILSLIGRVYDTTVNPQAWPAFLEEFADAVGGTTTTMFLYDIERPNGNIAAAVRFNPEHQKSYNEYYSRVDCFGVNGSRLVGTGDVVELPGRS